MTDKAREEKRRGENKGTCHETYRGNDIDVGKGFRLRAVDVSPGLQLEHLKEEGKGMEREGRGGKGGRVE